MAKPRPSDLDAGQLPLFGFVEYVRVDDDTYRALVRPPAKMVSIAVAAKIAAKSRDNIYRLFRTGFITGDQSSPGKIQINLDSLSAHLDASREADFWTPARKKRYRGK